MVVGAGTCLADVAARILFGAILQLRVAAGTTCDPGHMGKRATTMRSEDVQRGRAAAELVARNWPHPDGLVEYPTTEFANAAVQRLAELIARVG